MVPFGVSLLYGSGMQIRQMSAIEQSQFVADMEARHARLSAGLRQFASEAAEANSHFAKAQRDMHDTLNAIVSLHVLKTINAKAAVTTSPD